MKPLRVGQLAARSGLLLFLAWLYGGDLLRWGRAQGAEVAALSELPRLWLSLLGVAVVLGGAGALMVAARQKHPASWRPLRMLSIAVLSLLFLDFVVLSSRKSLLSPEEQAQLAVLSVAEDASQAAGSEAVPRDPQLLHTFIADLGPVPYFVDGERVPDWKIELRERCDGPATEPGQASVGTLIYCVAGDRKQAWVTLVGTPVGQMFGPRAVASVKEGWVGEVHVTAPEPELPAEPDDSSVWDPPTPDEAP